MKMLREKIQQKQQQHFYYIQVKRKNMYVVFFCAHSQEYIPQMLHKNLKLIKRNIKELEEKNERITKDFNSR